jgi:hypothetical protein
MLGLAGVSSRRDGGCNKLLPGEAKPVTQLVGGPGGAGALAVEITTAKSEDADELGAISAA